MQSVKLISLRNLIPELYVFYLLIAMEQGTRNKGIGLEISATYTFQHKKPSKLNKLRELLKDIEDKDDKAA